jgi:arylsulfatase
VLFIVLDDVGYGQLGCYGSPIATPNLDALAVGGLLYSNMHTTALCSPSRSCIITGRNHHANATAAINELATGYPGYNGQIPFENGFLSEMLQQRGYSTYMVGKYHLMPSEFESAAGPFDRWPLGRASSASTGSSAATPASGIRTWCTTTIRSSRRALPSRATT